VETTRATAAALVAVFDTATAADAARLASGLRREGIAVELYPAADKLKKQFRYADRKGIPRVVLAGPDEIAAGTVKVKDLASSEERTVPVAELARRLRDG
jgi:histidyl-tRNA synthetase